MSRTPSRGLRVRSPRFLCALLVLALVAVFLPSTAQAGTNQPPFPLNMPVAPGAAIMAGGPHPFDGRTGTMGSIDFMSPGDYDISVHAAAAGVVEVIPVRSRWTGQVLWPGCWIRIHHVDGWETHYYHLRDIPAGLDGSYVLPGQQIGITGTPGVDTCGHGSPHHVHFSLGLGPDWVNVDGVSIGGYTVHQGNNANGVPEPYCGTWTRDRDGREVINASYPSCGAKRELVNNEMPLRLLLPGQSFVDVPPRTVFADEINWMAQRRLSTGWIIDGNAWFRPGWDIQRDAYAAFIYRYMGSPAYTPPAVPIFTDVPSTHPFYKEISWLASTGISTGWDLGDHREFRPAVPIQRDAVAAFLYRLAGTHDYTPPETSPFLDVSAGQPFFTEISWLASKKVSTGWQTPQGSEFRPLASIKRDATAAFLSRLNGFFAVR